jgi:hypothetical protein
VKCKVCHGNGIGVCDECRAYMNEPILAALVAAGARDGEAVHETITRVRIERDDAVAEAWRLNAVEEQLAAEKARADAEANRAAKMEAQANREQTRADDLSRTVAALTDALECLVDVQNGPLLLGRHEQTWNAAMDAARAILSRPDVAAERGRWRKVDDIAEAMTLEQAQSAAAFAAEERDAARAALKAADAVADQYRVERDAAIARAEKAEGERDALGIQFAAQGERLRLAMAVVEAGRLVTRRDDDYSDAFEAAYAALDAVPGDALAKEPER